MRPARSRFWALVDRQVIRLTCLFDDRGEPGLGCLFAKGLIEPHHLGFQACGVEGFADGGVEGVAVEEGLEGGGNGVKVLLRADFTGHHCIGEDFLPERHFFLHNLVIALAKVRIVALNLQDEEKVGVGGILWQSLTDSIQIVCPGVDNAFQVGLDEVLEGHPLRVVHFAVDVLLFQYLADDDLAEEVQFGLGIIEVLCYSLSCQ